MIELDDYWMGRDDDYPLDMTPDIARNAARTVSIVNELLLEAMAEGVLVQDKPGADYGCCASGWRPPKVNANTKGASTTSMHMTGEALDIYDPDGLIDAWLVQPKGQATLERLGLWMEHPDDTPRWAHVQVRPPRSGNRVFRSGVKHT